MQTTCERPNNLISFDNNSNGISHPIISELPVSHSFDSARTPSVTVECFVNLPNDQIIKIDIDTRAVGQELLDKVCQRLGIISESEYFGFQYRGKYHEYLWLNIRNKVSRQVPSVFPYRFDFKVKYFVQPHTILSDETRHQFYLQTKNHIIEGCWNQGVSNEDLCHIISLMTQAEFGNYHSFTSTMKYALFWPKVLQEELNSTDIQRIRDYHNNLKDWTQRKIEYELLRLISESWLMYGVTFYDVTDCWSKSLKLGIGPDGLFLCSNKYGLIDRWVFDAITKVNCTDRVIEFVLIQDDGSTRIQKYSTKSAKASKSLHRYVTESFQFFKCDTVDVDILKDCKTVMHFFRKSNTCRSYFYDIVKTQKEVYDSARRRAYSYSSNNSPTNNIAHQTNNDVIQKYPESSQASDEVVVEMRKELEMLRELVQCVVCKDRKINRVFIPCMHIVCCEICASRLNQCPICRDQIKISHHAYPKWMADENATAGNKLCPLPEDHALTNAEIPDNITFY